MIAEAFDDFFLLQLSVAVCILHFQPISTQPAASEVLNSSIGTVAAMLDTTARHGQPMWDSWPRSSQDFALSRHIMVLFFLKG